MNRVPPGWDPLSGQTAAELETPLSGPTVVALETPRRPVAVRTEGRIAVVGTYPPRHCGIATFTANLAQAITTDAERGTPITVAVTDPGGRYDYPPEVRYEIRQGTNGDYVRAAEFLNYSDVGLALIQHEYGIFGGDDGAYVLDLISALRIPALVTLHTVLKEPSDRQRMIVRKMAQRCGLVVMSQTAANLLIGHYGIGADKIAIIAHGIPDMPPQRPDALKSAFGIAGRKMMLTFGLLGPNKGIETVIRGLPRLVQEFPNLVYFVVGATHPQVVRRHGEAYRTMLTREAAALGVADHVVFRDQFVNIDELCRYLQAADIFVSPYLSEAQVTSGALSYAMGAGAAVVSTPYWHARELLADGRGRLFPFGDSEGFADVVAKLLRSPGELERLGHVAFDYTRAMLWPRVGQSYLGLAQRAISEHAATVTAAATAPTPSRRPTRTVASELPELRLDHLLRMTDETGIVQHATFSVPARRSGYCVDDNARALIVALAAQRLVSSPETTRLVSTYLAYLHFAQTPEGTFENLLRYDRTFEPEAPSDDCLGRAIWALGTAVRLADDDGHRRLARQMLERALPAASALGPRGTASTILGLCAFLTSLPEVAHARAALESMTGKLLAAHQRESAVDWSWFESTLTYDNALIPLALFKAFAITGDRAALRVARESIEFLEEICFAEGRLNLVGNAGWHSRGGEKALVDEQPTDAAALVLAFRGAYLVTADRHYLGRMRQAFAWFLGANRLQESLYDFATGGCRDALCATEVNRNEGAESTLSFLLALLEMMELAGELPLTEGRFEGRIDGAGAGAGVGN